MIRVLVVDDSIVFRKILQNALSRHSTIKVVGTAVNGKDALSKIPRLRPHMLILDVEMPEMDGLQTLDAIKKRRMDVGVIMFSSLTLEGARTTLEALAKGAFDFVPKPSGRGAFGESVKNIEQELIPKIEAYASSLTPSVTGSSIRRAARPRSIPKPARTAVPGQTKPEATPSRATAVSGPRHTSLSGLRPEAVAIGVSTGGPNALDHVIPKLPQDFNRPVFLVQHMPPVFTGQLARRLDEKSKITVIEARDRQPVLPGTVYIAPGNYHMIVESDNGQKIIRLNQAPPENSCRPSVDVLFRSVAEIYGPRILAVIMTGMGKDGLEGCRQLKARGAFVMAQDKESCVVWGMPKFVTEEGLADRVCPLDQIAPTIMKAFLPGQTYNTRQNRAGSRAQKKFRGRETRS